MRGPDLRTDGVLDGDKEEGRTGEALGRSEKEGGGSEQRRVGKRESEKERNG